MGRTQYDPVLCRANHNLHYGSGFPVFRGEIRQDGYGLGGIFSGLARGMMSAAKPIAKMAITSLKKAPKLAMSSLRTGSKRMMKMATPMVKKVGKQVVKKGGRHLTKMISGKRNKGTAYIVQHPEMEEGIDDVVVVEQPRKRSRPRTRVVRAKRRKIDILD